MVRRSSTRQPWLRHLWQVTLAGAAVLALAVPAAAQNVLQGTVVDAQGQPVEGAKITIVQTDEVTRKFEAKSDKKGTFTQIGLQTSNYKVTAEKDKVGVATTTTRVGGGRPVSVRLVLGAAEAVDPTVAQKAADLRKAFDEGVSLSKDGKYDDSVAAFNRALGVNPKCADCYYNIGYAYGQKKEFDKAEENYKKALEVKPDYPDAYNGLANIYNTQKKFDLAAEASKKAAELSASAPGGGGGGNADSLYNQGVILWNSGKIADAKKAFEAALAANPNHAEAHYQLAMALVNEGNLAGAAAEFNNYLKLAPDGPNAAQAKALVAQLPK